MMHACLHSLWVGGFNCVARGHSFAHPFTHRVAPNGEPQGKLRQVRVPCGFGFAWFGPKLIPGPSVWRRFSWRELRNHLCLEEEIFLGHPKLVPLKSEHMFHSEMVQSLGDEVV